MKANKQDIAALLATVEAELVKAHELNKAQLLKADDDELQGRPPLDQDSPPEQEASDSPMPPPDAAPEAPPAEPEMGNEAPPEAPPAEPGMGEEGQEAPLSPEALQAAYAELPPEELDMHIQAAMAAKEAMGAAPAGAPPQAPEAPPALKADDSDKEESSSKEESSMSKSEIQSLKAEMEEMKKNHEQTLATLTKAVTVVLERPERKAVTSIAFLGKSEEADQTVNPQDVRAKLRPHLASLTKSELSAVSDFYVTGKGFEAVAPIVLKYTKP